ncbi:MAG: hypothetical protein ABI806_26050 [Candidatus Solibacter sp.]
MHEFYVGYLPIPPGIRKFARRVIGVLGVIVVGAAIALALSQGPFAASTFEFRDYREFDGVLVTKPYPALVVPGGLPWLLAGEGKHGFTAPNGFEGRTVRIRGERITRGADRMLEVQSVIAGDPSEALTEIDLGPTQLTGEIVDTKCYFGVMNPGNGKVHRDCAARCLSGGVPPALLVRDASGVTKTVLIANWRGELLNHVAEPITLRGRLANAGGRLVLYAE